jgi:serine protease Do
MKKYAGVSVRLALASALLLGVPFQAKVRGQEATPTATPPAPLGDLSALDHAEALSTAFHQAADSVLPAVVTIKSKMNARRVTGSSQGRGENPFKGTPFEEFFNGQEFGAPFEGQMPRREGTGSGVIINRDGLVLTNNHVVQGADVVVVELADGRSFEAEDIRTDPKTDLAILRIKSEERLPAARLGDSDAVDIGDWVLAIGNPFELSSSVSAGIISAKGRSLGSAERASFLQTDAAINPGNSGGPLVNLRGEVVGINTAIASSSGGHQGIGFAVPVNLAKWVIDQLVSNGSVSRAYLGIGIGAVTAEDVRMLNLPAGTKGVVVKQVNDESPAAKAGIRTDDVVTHFAGTPVSGPADLQRVVERSPLGSKQVVSVLRDGKPMEVEVTTEVLPDEDARTGRGEEKREQTEESSLQEELGMSLMDLTPELVERLDLPAGTTNGVLVAQVAPGGIARESGVARGMMIAEVNGQAVSSVKEFEAAMTGVSLERGVRVTVRVPGVGTRGLVLKQR